MSQINQLDILDQLGPDADLLTRSDNWLASQQLLIAQQMTQLASDLRAILRAKDIKRKLQQTNQVAVRRSQAIGESFDDVIEIMPLPDAVQAIRSDPRPVLAGQVGIWESDGYDVPTAAALR